MAKKPPRAANRTPYDGGGALTTPGSDVKRDDRPYTAWSLGGGEQVDPSYASVNPAGATPVPWVSGAAPDVSPFNQANAAAMRGYTRNAPYLEKLVNDPRRMISEMQDLQLGLRENPNDPVAEYRLRILRQAMGDIYGIQPKEFMGYPTAPMYPTTGKR